MPCFSSQVVDNFDDMQLKEELLRGIYAYGFEKPSAIQQRAILPCVKGHDVIAQAQSGEICTLIFILNNVEEYFIISNSSLQYFYKHIFKVFNSIFQFFDNNKFI